MADKGGGPLYTFGNSKAAINLMGNILENPGYVMHRRKALRLLSKQTATLTAVMAIKNKSVREASLEMWHKRFATLISDLPEVVKSHVLCVETGLYRKLLEESKARGE